ncbi:WxL protein peptidoglycan domain-containing protein [Alicyclobacillus sp. SO9]|uniref:WxL protein peptidoglycan domain-containing protein n=1 Tax=Alicyclobacillus sp. SO9 TaxID=2665646 RepID=UPI0018E8F693|nr:DUF916 domain-containing protein [Alicyclobacillus sp. SO9]QQE79523.1 DUF916 domain-containing protein [Alicyclobacillus sp. SO9]
MTVGKVGKWVSLVASGVTTVVFASATALAASSTTLTTGSSMNFTANPTNHSQVDPTISTYFLDKGSQGKVLHESLQLASHSSQTIQVHLFATTASNGLNGNIVYGLSPKHTWIKKLPGVVTLRAHQTKQIPFEVVVPQDTTSGDHLFAISCSDGQHQQHIRNTGKSGIELGINESVRRVVAVEVEVPGVQKVAFDLNHVKVGTYPSGQYYEVSGADQSNVILKNISGSMTLYKGTRQVLTRTLTGLSFAPNEPITFEDRWVKGAAPIGTYHVQIVLRGKGLGKYTKKLSFKITPPAIRHYDQLTGHKGVQLVVADWTWWVMGGLGLLTMGMVGYVVVLRRRRWKGESS